MRIHKKKYDSLEAAEKDGADMSNVVEIHGVIYEKIYMDKKIKKVKVVSKPTKEDKVEYNNLNNNNNGNI